MMLRTILFLSIFIMSISLFIQCGMDSDTVATVGDLKITVEELKEQLSSRYPNHTEFTDVEYEKKKQILDQIIEKKQKMNAALDNDLEDDPQFAEMFKKQEDNLVGQKFFETIVVDKLLSKEEVEDFIERQGTQLKPSYIIIGYDKAHIAKDRTKEEALKIALEVIQKARSGQDFKELALQYSDDPSVKRTKGEYGYFRWGQRPKAFQEACWNLNVGEISDVVELNEGLHIIKLEDKKEDPNYKAKTDHNTVLRAKQTLYSAVADSGKKMWDKYIEELKQQNGFKIYDEAVNKVAQIFNERARNAKVDLNSFSDEEKNIVLADWDGDNIVLNKILTRYENNLTRVLGALRDPKNLRKELQNLSIMSLAIREAKKMGIQNDEYIVESLQSFKYNQLANLADRKLVNENIEYTDEDVRKYYDENPDQFMTPAKMEIWAVTVKEKDLAKKVAAKAKHGSNFEDLARKYSIDKYYKDKGGYLGFRTINSRGSISKAAFELGPDGKISDPVKFKKDWAVVKTGELKEEKIRPFQEVSRMVEGRLKNNLMQKKRAAWKEELNQKYAAKINEEVLKNI